jgi:rubredoxin-NAD+ reductase
MEQLVIIGTGLAGYSLAREYRKLDSARHILLLTADDGNYYSKPMLSTGFSKGKTAADLSIKSAAIMAVELKSEIRTAVTVSSIDTNTHQLTLSSGEMHVYGQLVFAMGAEVIRPQLGGDATDCVFTINDLQDYAQFRKQLTGKKRVAIIGAGLIGCEFANDLSNAGFEVTVIESGGLVLANLLPESASMALKTSLEKLGVGFYINAAASDINYAAGALILTLADKTNIETDIVLSAVGLRPRTILAKASGIKVNRGIITNNLLETSVADIYALGDCAEVAGHVLMYVLPLMAAARALAKTLFGESTAVDYQAMPITIKTPACPIIVSPAPIGVNGTWQTQYNDENVSALFHDEKSKLRGFALTGDEISQKVLLTKQLPAIL